MICGTHGDAHAIYPEAGGTALVGVYVHGEPRAAVGYADLVFEKRVGRTFSHTSVLKLCRWAGLDTNLEAVKRVNEAITLRGARPLPVWTDYVNRLSVSAALDALKPALIGVGFRTCRNTHLLLAVDYVEPVASVYTVTRRVVGLVRTGRDTSLEACLRIGLAQKRLCCSALCCAHRLFIA